MAIYDGFFDAQLNQETFEYDRTYGPDDFTGYFAQIIGTGVSIYNNPDSMKVRYENNQLLIHDGYLFINGYWLKNTEDYPLNLTISEGTRYIIAWLDYGSRRILLENSEEIKENSICLAKVVIGSDLVVKVEDTRADTEICGVIESLGDVSIKLDEVLNYIDTEIEQKLQQIEQDLSEKSQELEKQISKLQQQAEKLEPPIIGTVKYSASQLVDDTWLRCDGSFINENDYPELVEALGKFKPASNDFFLVAQDNNISTKLSNVVYVSGFMYVYSQTANKLYKINTETNEVTEIAITFNLGGTGSNFHTMKTVYLSIVDTEIYLTQSNNVVSAPFVRFFKGTLSEGSIEMTYQDLQSNLEGSEIDYLPDIVIPTVGKFNDYYYMVAGIKKTTISTGAILKIVKWKSDNIEFQDITFTNKGIYENSETYQQIAAIQGFFIKNNYNSYQICSNTGSYNYRIYNILTNEELSPRPLTISASSPSMVTGDCVPTGNNKEVLYKIVIIDNKPRVVYYNKNTVAFSIFEIENITLPSTAKIYPESLEYCELQDLWICFVGTGFIFSRTPADAGSWGYLDTTDMLGLITKNGGCVFVEEELAFYFYGATFDNKFKIAKLKIEKWFEYSSDGAFLPYMESDGIPAYIKAKGDEALRFKEITVTVSGGTSLPPFKSIFNVTLNGETLVNATDVIFNSNGTLQMIALQDYLNETGADLAFTVSFGGTTSTPALTQLMGRTIKNNEKLLAGEVISIPINLKTLYDTYSAGTKETEFTFKVASLAKR